MACFLVALLFFFRVLQVQTDIQEALVYAGRKSAADSSSVTSDIGCVGLAAGYFRNELKTSSPVQKYVKNGVNGISLIDSRAEDDYIVLKASCRITVPIGFFQLDSIRLLVGNKSRKWTGKTEGVEGGSDPIVYYTETGTVYHTTKTCSYLDLSVHSAKFQEIVGLRNKNGHKYNACSKCAAKKGETYIVFITDFGTVYHVDAACPGLKRTIYEAHLSEVNLRPCKKCSK